MGILPAAEYVFFFLKMHSGTGEISTGCVRRLGGANLRWTWTKIPLITWPPQVPTLMGRHSDVLGFHKLLLGHRHCLQIPPKSGYFLCTNAQSLYWMVTGSFWEDWEKINTVHFGQWSRVLSQEDLASPSIKEFWKCKLAQVWELIEGLWFYVSAVQVWISRFIDLDLFCL